MYVGLSNLGLNSFAKRWSPADLFSASEQGQVLDRQNLSSMWQDSTGTTAVYQPGQGLVDPPVGLALDVKHGLARGVEVLPDPGFDNPASWNTGGSGGHASVAGSAAVLVGLLNSETVVTCPAGAGENNKVYEVFITVVNYVSGTIGVRIRTGTTVQMGVTGNGTYRAIVQAGSGSATGIYGNSAGANMDVTSFSIREIPGNHEIQATAASRPKLSGRVNVLLNTAFAGAVAGSPGTTPTSWATIASGTNSLEIVSAGRLKLSGTGSSRLMYYQSYSLAEGAVMRFRLPITASSGTGTIAALTASAGAATFVNPICSAPFTGEFISTVTGGVGGATILVRVGAGATTTCPDDTSVTFEQPDFRLTADVAGLPAYQRVTDASNYDTSGFPLFLDWDGVDDSMATAATVDFSATDKMFVAAGLTKLSDAATGIYTELSTTVSGNTGAFYLGAPVIASNYAVAGKGTSQATRVYNGFDAPHSAVVTGSIDIAAPLITLSINRLSASTTTTMGTGNFGNHTLYTGRRGGSSMPYRGRDYARVILGRTATATEIANTERWIAGKMGGLVTLP